MINMARKIYDFKEDLNSSQHEAGNDDWWKIYEMAFPEMMHMEEVKDKDLQKHQLDRILLMNNKAEIRVEEKVDHYKNERVAIEEWADTTKKIPGWIQKQSSAALDSLQKEEPW